jgi:hypothetical protein
MRPKYRLRMSAVHVQSIPLPEALPQGQGLAASTNWNLAG